MFVYYIPIATTILAIAFGSIVMHRYLVKKGPHLLWWALGIFIFGLGTFVESYVTIFGWNEAMFRLWYISGALLGGAPLAQGTVYLMLERRTANILTCVLLPVIATAAICVLITPLDHNLVEQHRLSGKVIEWYWVRLFSPFINVYALLFLAGGAALSAYRFYGNHNLVHRFIGNVFITIGAILPGIGGAFTRFGYTEVLYVTEFIGLLLIFIGYYFNVKQK